MAHIFKHINKDIVTRWLSDKPYSKTPECYLITKREGDCIGASGVNLRLNTNAHRFRPGNPVLGISLLIEIESFLTRGFH